MCGDPPDLPSPHLAFALPRPPDGRPVRCQSSLVITLILLLLIPGDRLVSDKLLSDPFPGDRLLGDDLVGDFTANHVSGQFFYIFYCFFFLFQGYFIG